MADGMHDKKERRTWSQPDGGGSNPQNVQEVEEVVDRAKDLEPFVVGHVTSVGAHPNADRLQLCTVDVGSGQFQVVCGAPNARPGIKGVFAPIGSFIPGLGSKLEEREIRGIIGEGMLCSERELGLSEDDILCFTAAGLRPIKGYAHQIQAMRYLEKQQQFRGIKFAWAGDGPMREFLEQQIAKFGLVERVHMLGHSWDVAEWFDAADMFIWPPLGEGMPAVVLRPWPRACR